MIVSSPNNRLLEFLKHVFGPLLRFWKRQRVAGTSSSILLQSMTASTGPCSIPEALHSKTIYVECETAWPLQHMGLLDAPRKIQADIIRILRYASVADASVDGISMYCISAKYYAKVILTSDVPFRIDVRSRLSSNSGRMVIVRQCPSVSSVTDGLKKVGSGRLVRKDIPNSVTKNLNQLLRRQRWRLDSISLNISKRHLILSTERSTHGA